MLVVAAVAISGGNDVVKMNPGAVERIALIIFVLAAI